VFAANKLLNYKYNQLTVNIEQQIQATIKSICINKYPNVRIGIGGDFSRVQIGTQFWIMIQHEQTE
jgi:hypothetical protein